MSTYRIVDVNLNFVEREKKVEQLWKDNNIFQKSIDGLVLIHNYISVQKMVLIQNLSLKKIKMIFIGKENIMIFMKYITI